MARTSISSLPTRERFVFHHFWNLLSLTSAVASWSLACWELTGRGVVLPPWWAQASVVAALTMAYRLSARVLESPVEPSPLVNGVSQAVLATGFVSVVTGVGLLAAVPVWWLATWLAQGFGTPALAGIGLLPPDFAPQSFRPVGDALIAASVCLHTYGYAHGFRRLRVQELTIPIVGLPAAFDGYRILHVSDIHLGPLAHRSTLRQAFERARTLCADLVCVTGDVVDTPNADLDYWVPELRALDAPDGVLTILGNHDRHAGAQRVATALATMTHWRVLRDETTAITRGDAQLHLIGVEDARHADATAALERVHRTLPADATAIALVHHPAVFARAAALGIPLTLAGHTHGGQLAVPFAPRINAARVLGLVHDFGVFTVGRSRLHVSRGLGTSGQRVRVGAPRDLTLIRLVAG